MDAHTRLVSSLAQDNGSKIVLLILDGVGDIAGAAQEQTPLQAARTPHLDALAAKSSLGRIVPVATGITPGSGPGHLALFGYDPALPRHDIGRGVLEALGLGLELAPGQVAARGNFATVDAGGLLTDRRAGRPTTEENQRVCARLSEALAGRDFDGATATVHAGEGHRFVLLLSGPDLAAELADTDPQETGVPAFPARALEPRAQRTAAVVDRVVETLREVLAGEPTINALLLRGFATLPHLPPMPELYRMRCGAFAGYPLYRGVAAACGMEVVPCGKRFADAVAAAASHWDDFDFFFLHVKQTDMAGEDGDAAAKTAVIEEVDAGLPELLALAPAVLAITGDHSTPAPMRAHSWHPVPLLVHAADAYVDGGQRFEEESCIRGHLGTFPSRELIGLLLAHAGRLAKYGA